MTGATLTIDAGVEVRFEPGGALLVQEGKLDVRGTATLGVVFTANHETPVAWLLARPLLWL